MKLFPAKSIQTIDVLAHSEEQNLRLLGLDLSAESVLLKFPVPSPLFEKVLSLCIHVQGQNQNEIIYCQGQAQANTNGRRLHLINLTDSTRATLQNLYH